MNLYFYLSLIKLGMVDSSVRGDQFSQHIKMRLSRVQVYYYNISVPSVAPKYQKTGRTSECNCKANLIINYHFTLLSKYQHLPPE